MDGTRRVGGRSKRLRMNSRKNGGSRLGHADPAAWQDAISRETAATTLAEKAHRNKKKQKKKAKSKSKSSTLPPDASKITMKQQNPKRGKSKLRYDRYKAAKTLAEYYSLGGTPADARFDISRGFLVVE